MWNDGATIRGIRFDPAGDPVGGEFLVGSGHVPHVARASDGRFVVTWLLSASTDVLARRFDSSGNPAGNAFTVSSTPLYYGSYWSDVAVSPHGDFVVVWDGGACTGYCAPSCMGYGCQGYRDVFGQSFDASGNYSGPEFIIDSGRDSRASVGSTPVSN